MGGRIDHLDVQRRGLAEAAFFLGDALGRQGEHHQHRLVAVAREDLPQRRAVRRHQAVAKLLDGGERPGCTFGRGSRRGVARAPSTALSRSMNAARPVGKGIRFFTSTRLCEHPQRTEQEADA